MSSSLKPQDKGYWNAPARRLAMNLPGEVIVAADKEFVIKRTQGFQGLIRQAMKERAIARRNELKPGDILVTQFRGSPQLNIAGKVPENENPDVVWMMKLLDDGKEIAGSRMAREIAEKLGITIRDQRHLMEFCLSTLDGQNVQDSNGHIQIVGNEELPTPATRRKNGWVTFDEGGGNADNSVGVGELV